MGFVNEYVEVNVGMSTDSYYRDLGYEIPTHKNKNGKLVSRGLTIMVKITDLPKSSKKKIDYYCDNCNKVLHPTICDYTKCNHDGKYYCNPCSLKLFSSGENNPRWNKNLTQEEREMNRNYSEYFEFLRIVQTRENNTCQVCKSKEKVIVHHLDGYNWCKEKRTDPTNGVCLCDKCHSNFHSHYGKGNNTKEQFIEWLEKNGLSEKDFFEKQSYIPTLSKTKKVYVYELDKIFDSTTIATKELKIKSPSKVWDACTKGSTIYGYHLFWEDDYLKLKKENKLDYEVFLRTSVPKGVKIFNTITGDYYLSQSEAVRNSNQTKEHIAKFLKMSVKDDILPEWITWDTFLNISREQKEKILKLNATSNNNEPSKYSSFLL